MDERDRKREEYYNKSMKSFSMKDAKSASSTASRTTGQTKPPIVNLATVDSHRVVKVEDELSVHKTQSSVHKLTTPRLDSSQQKIIVKGKHGSQMTTGITSNDDAGTITTNRLIDELKQEVDFDRDFDKIYDNLMEDISLLGDVHVQEPTDEFADGFLLFADFCRINKLIKKYTHPSMVPSLKAMIAKRRATLVNQDHAAYRELAFMSSECEENFTQKVSDVVLEHFKVNQDIFFESWKRGLEEDEHN